VGVEVAYLLRLLRVEEEKEEEEDGLLMTKACGVKALAIGPHRPRAAVTTTTAVPGRSVAAPLILLGGDAMASLYWSASCCVRHVGMEEGRSMSVEKLND
jgi:hypothetical protein